MTTWISAFIQLRRRVNAWLIGSLLSVLGLASPLSASGGSILTTKHNLSASGLGEIRAESESGACMD